MADRALHEVQDWYAHLNAMIHGKGMANRAVAVGFGHLYWILALHVEPRIARFARVDPINWVQSFVDECLVMIKVGFFIGIELVTFPLGCGFLLDWCTLSLVSTTVEHRIT